MIITKTPLRISFAGGGSDLPAFYMEHGGAVVSMTINKFVYVMLNTRFDSDIRVSYSRTEIAKRITDINHDIVRNCLSAYKATRAIEVVTVADIPGHGSGLGSSSALTVGLVNALEHYTLKMKPIIDWVANVATHIEIDLCQKPIGKQDQYASAFGGLNYIEFRKGGSVEVTKIEQDHDFMVELDNHLMLFYMERHINGDAILKLQNDNLSTNVETAKNTEKMVKLAVAIKQAIEQKEIVVFGRLLHEGWKLKRGLAPLISNPRIDDVYNRARDAGALGGKICGAGGGGFMLLCVPPEKHVAVRTAINLREMPFTYCNRGSEVIYVG